MWKKPRFCRIQDMIYPDRCMLKWQGMLLSDHNERIRSDETAEAVETDARHHTEAEYETWDRLIEESRVSGRMLIIRVARPGEGGFTVRGRILGVQRGHLCIAAEQGEILIAHHEVEEIKQ